MDLVTRELPYSVASLIGRMGSLQGLWSAGAIAYKGHGL